MKVPVASARSSLDSFPTPGAVPGANGKQLPHTAEMKQPVMDTHTQKKDKEGTYR